MADLDKASSARPVNTNLGPLSRTSRHFISGDDWLSPSGFRLRVWGCDVPSRSHFPTDGARLQAWTARTRRDKNDVLRPFPPIYCRVIVLFHFHPQAVCAAPVLFRVSSSVTAATATKRRRLER